MKPCEYDDQNKVLSLNQDENTKRLHRACFTGHRPEKLAQTESEIVDELEQAIRIAVSDGFTTFIFGMARGVDIWAAETVLQLRSEGYPIHLVSVSPFVGFERNWSPKWQQRYNAVLQAADLVKFISPSYTPNCFQMRNEWMVNHSARVIAVYNGSAGETKNTIDYAQSKNVDVVLLVG